MLNSGGIIPPPSAQPRGRFISSNQSFEKCSLVVVVNHPASTVCQVTVIRSIVCVSAAFTVLRTEPSFVQAKGYIRVYVRTPSAFEYFQRVSSSITPLSRGAWETFARTLGLLCGWNKPTTERAEVGLRLRWLQVRSRTSSFLSVSVP